MVGGDMRRIGALLEPFAFLPLTIEGREVTLMYVELFAVCGATLKFDSSRLSVDEDVSRNDSDVFAVCENIQQSSLSRSRGSHKGSKLSGFNISENIVQQSQLLSPTNRNIILQILPSQHLFRGNFELFS